MITERSSNNLLTNLIPYSNCDQRSIVSYARKLEGRTLRQVLPPKYLSEILSVHKKGKGSFGLILEEGYFYIKPNTESAPDFHIIGIELKSSPLKMIRSGEMRSKERLVLSMINFNKIVKEDWETSSFLRKNSKLLLVFYSHEKGKNLLDYRVLLADLWELPPEDKVIIRGDWLTIVNRIKSGKAEELSEGLTDYLGACPKGATKQSKQSQPFSQEKAMQRAFSFKSPYVYSIYDRILRRRNNIREDSSNSIIKSVSEVKKRETFEELVNRKFANYLGKTSIEISKEFSFASSSSKSYYRNLTVQLILSILGVKGKRIVEFERAGITLRVIRLPFGSNKPKESISFPQIDYCEIVNETWDTSTLRETLSSRFFFVFFRAKKDSTDFVLDQIGFWTMPLADLDGIVRDIWIKTVREIRSGDYKHFTKISDDKIIHIRPHTRDKTKVRLTPHGTSEKIKSFWLNSSYVSRIYSATREPIIF